MPIALAMGWRHLLFENWPIVPSAMSPHLPDGLTVDAIDGSAWLSVVPFTNVSLRPAALSFPAGVRLPELNVRTYVTCDGQPGVYFFSLDAQGILSVLGARLFHALPYFYARISLDVVGDAVRFDSRRYHPGARPATYRARYRPTDELQPATGDPLTKFLFERYHLYTEGLDGSLRCTTVEHEPWTVAPATAAVETSTVIKASGFEIPDAEPRYFYSQGLDVVALPSTRVS